eukprot:TRINITY_DN4452_c0_g2_i1.p1 TRINITY_DN4452_c0_g2~~TRINITY_DN4452_c0_g2_i1.p1  ORF type:complete len:1125 (-),score=272.13 TRINITY_DN4452_c0_g2_i1:99-3242(-)
MPKDPGAYLAVRLMQQRGLPHALITECREWLFHKRGICSSDRVADGDRSGGSITSGGESKASTMVPQTPPKPDSWDGSRGPSPKAKFLVSVQADEQIVNAEDTDNKSGHSAQDAQDELGVKFVADEEDEVWNYGDSSSESDGEDEEESNQESLCLRRATAKVPIAPANMDTRKRRFTVSLDTLDLPPPPPEETVSYLAGVPFFENFSEAELQKIAKVVKCKQFEEDEIIFQAGNASDNLHIVVKGNAKLCVPFFENFSEAELQKIAKVVKCKQFEEDEIIFQAGNASDNLHIVVKGNAKLCVPVDAGKVGIGGFFGDEALRFSGAKYLHQASASLGGVMTISISKDDFKALDLKRPLIKKTDDAKKAKKVQIFASDTAPSDEACCSITGCKLVKDHTQTQAEKDAIKKAIVSSKVLGEVVKLSEQQLERVCKEVYLIEAREDQTVVSEGDNGKGFFIAHRGLLRSSSGLANKYLRPGESFGELALLYECNLDQTVVSDQPSTLWVLTRSSFQTISMMSGTERITAYKDTLLNIPCITALDDENVIDMICSALEDACVLEGENVCTQGEDEGTLFLLLSGTATLTRDDKFVKNLQAGDWVGEESLTQNKPADCTVRVTSEEAVISILDSASFKVCIKAVSSFKKKKESAGGTFSLADSVAFADTVLKKEVVSANQRDAFKKSKGRGSVAETKKGTGSIFCSEEFSVGLNELTKVGALGEGSFGTVALMSDSSGERLFALKGLLKEQIKKENMLQNVANERSVMALLDSDFIVRLYSTYQDPTYVYFLQECVLGGELFDVYCDNSLFGSLSHAKFYIGCVILGLAHMHSKRVIYRDLKLENCLLDSQGYVKLADMGIAKLVLGKTYTICGTADFFAPETLRQQGHNRAADWWACGVLLFVMVAGVSPFDAPEVSQIYKNIIKGFSKVKFPEFFPSDLIDVIKSLCRKSPEERITMQRGGVENLKEMPFFSNMDWEKLESRSMAAPYMPPPANMEKIKAKEFSRPMEIDHDKITVWNGGVGSSDKSHSVSHPSQTASAPAHSESGHEDGV